LEAKRAMTLLVLWADYERISKQASAAEESMEKTLNGVKAEFETEKTRFTQEFQALKQQPDRSDATLQKGRDLKLQSAAAFTNLKNRLQKFLCWPEVQDFDKELEDIIAKLRTSKTSIAFGSDFEIEEIPEDQNPFGNEEQLPPATGQRWILESVTPSHTTFPAGWNYSSGSATGTIYNGDRFQITWTPPPPQIDSNGFSISLNVQATTAVPSNSIAGLVSVSTSGLDSDTPSDQRQAYATGTGNASASKSIHFKPVQNAYSVEVNVGVMWEVSYTYLYRRAD
jgi:hypothetical protein